MERRNETLGANGIGVGIMEVDMYIGDEKQILVDAIETFGTDKQIIKAIEELSELQKELCKHIFGEQNHDNIAEEMADVEIMLAQLEIIFMCGLEKKAYKKKKLVLLAERILKERIQEEKKKWK